MRQLGLVVHPSRDSHAAVGALLAWARREGVAVVGLAGERARLPDGVPCLPEAAVGPGSDLVVGLGGDGTILRALSVAAPHAVPVLGVNLGRVAFLAETDVEDIPTALTAVAEERHALERRAALAVVLEEEAGEAQRFTAYNDVVISRPRGVGQAALALELEGETFARYAADAVIVSTSTGSTAYNFSAGGPILSPRLEAMVVTPVATSGSFNRAVVVHPEESVRLTALERNGRLGVEVDGREAAEVGPGCRIDVGMSPHPALVVRLRAGGFYARARGKLHLSDPVQLRGAGG